MGDIAEDHVDQMIENGTWGFAAPRPRRLQRERDAAVCNRCGSTSVHWRCSAALGWRLYDNEKQHPGNRYPVHDCTPQPSADGFEDEPV